MTEINESAWQNMRDNFTKNYFTAYVVVVGALGNTAIYKDQRPNTDKEDNFKDFTKDRPSVIAIIEYNTSKVLWALPESVIADKELFPEIHEMWVVLNNIPRHYPDVIKALEKGKEHGKT